MGELGKMTQFKDKSQKTGREGQIAGLFDYPVLMAGDVLLYDADEIPVGVDQVQHVELARTIAQRFNNSHGETFKVPKATLTENSSRIMSLNEPEKKMSKSESADSYVAMDDKPEAIIKKFKRAVTDSDNIIKKAADKPAISNLLAIYSGFTDKSIEEIEKEYEGAGYGKFKTDLGEIVAGVLDSWQKRFLEIRQDNDRIQNVISEGNSKAETLAKEKLGIVKDKLGLH